MKRPFFEARLVWHVVGHRPECPEPGYCDGTEEHVVGAYTVETSARAEAEAIGGYYVLVCNVLSAHGPWRRLDAPDGTLLRMQSEHADWTADDYAAWWSRVNVPVRPARAA